MDHKNKLKLAILRTTNPLYGGSRYESMAMNAVSTSHTVTSFDVSPWFPWGQRPQSCLRMAFAERLSKTDIWIRDEIALTCMIGQRKQTRNIGIIHHLDDTVGPLRAWNRALHKRLLINASKCERIVVVSQYWRRRLAELGIKDTVLIHNGFDVPRFAVSELQIQEFKKRHGFGPQPVIYVGNCQLRKGAPAVWSALKNTGYQLVTSGLSDVDLPIRKFLLGYEEYILLLAASEVVVTMSDFEEGWNRTAHEALLCRTPVVGSGTGGMGELLKGGAQSICERVSDLPEIIRYSIANRLELGRLGYAFASAFTTERFNQEWLGVVNAL